MGVGQALLPGNPLEPCSPPWNPRDGVSSGLRKSLKGDKREGASLISIVSSIIN